MTVMNDIDRTPKQTDAASSQAASLTPREIVHELDRHIVGQNDAKRAVAIALRNRWRRQQLEPTLREEVMPKNILMIGPTGVGKTEIARRLAKLAQAPVHQGRGHQVHRGRLCRPRRRADRARPAGDRDLHDQGQDEAPGPGQGRGSRGRPRARRPGRRRRQRRHAAQVPQDAAQRRARRQGDRAEAEGDRRRRASPPSRFPACPAPRWA